MSDPINETNSEFRFLELIEFSIKRTLEDGVVVSGIYGVNVAKVREVIRMPKLNRLSSVIPEVVGIFEHRGVPIPAVHLARFLGEKEPAIDPKNQVLILEFNNKRAGFIVDSTKKIRRVHVTQILPPSYDCLEGISAMTLIENNEFMFILDFEMILSRIEGPVVPPAPEMAFDPKLLQQMMMQMGMATQNQNAAGQGKGAKVLVVDDSTTARRALVSILKGEGYSVIEANNGVEGVEALEKAVRDAGEGDLRKVISMVITDVEMPLMDGYTLTRHIKGHDLLKGLPVIMHSSLTGNSNRDRGLKAGCDYYVSKFDRDEIAKALEMANKAA